MDLIKQIDETFKFENKEIRVIGSYNEPLFVAKDICDILELSNITNALRNIPEKWMTLQNVKSSYNSQNMIMLSEPAVYKLIMRSNKPIAQKFQEVVCEEILPSLRNKGEYKIQTILDKQNELTLELKKKDERIKKLQRETQVVDGKNVCYLCTANEKESEGIYTIGKAINLKNRLENYNSNKLFNFKMVYYISCKSVQLMDSIEKILLSKLNKYKILSTRDVFQLPDGKDVTFFTQYFDILKNFCEDIEEDLVLEERNQEELRELENEFKEENKEAKSEYNKEYRTEHHEEILEREAVFRELNKEQLRERTLDYHFNNRDELNEKQREKAAKRTEEEISKKKEYMKVYRKENAEHIAESKRKYNEEKKEIMEERIKCACGSFVSRQNMTAHLDTDRHKKYLETGKTMDETRKEDYIICACGMSISKRGIKRHEGSKIHKSYVKACDANKIE
jgi:prophage antirepressor-like protein